MNIINFMEKEEWKYIYEFDDFNNKEKFFVTICENTGTKINVETQSISDRKDLCVFIPTLFLDMSNSPIKKDVKKIVKNNFFKGYESDYFPITKSINNNIKVITIKNKVSISFNGVKKNINFSDDALIFLKKNYFISLIIKIEHEIYITRLKVRGKKEFPIFAIKYITIKSIKNKSLDLLIKSINTNDFSILANDKLFLDCIGTSDYEVYQSTSSEESLPSVSKLKFGSSCYNCGKNEVSKEHCSPKWLSDKYNVKPLIGDFLCKECNNKFGEIYENGIQELLLKKEWNEEEKSKVVKWCFKTSLTMSIASGVAINIDFLRNLENNLPENIEIYFNKNIPFNEKGFNYGVSKFNKELTKNNTFLFTFICTDFSFFVISKNTLNSDNIPYNKIYPDFNILRDNIAYKFNNIADFHKILHEYLSGEKTTDFTLPIREQKR
jgi:hypothetical protein